MLLLPEDAVSLPRSNNEDTGRFATMFSAASPAKEGRLFKGKNITNAIKKIVLFFINNNSKSVTCSIA